MQRIMREMIAKRVYLQFLFSFEEEETNINLVYSALLHKLPYLICNQSSKVYMLMVFLFTDEETALEVE